MRNYRVLNKKNLFHNLEFVKGSGKKICAVVKADAYGHGSFAIASALSGKVNSFAVATLDEALRLRRNFRYAQILILSKTTKYSLAIKNHIDITVDSLDEVKEIVKISKAKNIVSRVHIKVNTGMNRLGVDCVAKFVEICRFVAKSDYVVLGGVYTHFATADCDKVIFDRQMRNFYNFIKVLPKNLSQSIHIGGSHVLKYKLPEWIDTVRVGLYLYGYGDKRLKKVMSIHSQIVEIRHIKSGEYVGYSKGFRAKGDMTIATISIGYADGLIRSLSNIGKVKIANKPCPIIGNICMDMLMCDITKYQDIITKHSPVVAFDNASTISKLLSLSEYEILTNFSRLRR